MSAMKAFMEDQEHYYAAGLAAGYEGNVFRLAAEMDSVYDDAHGYADPLTVAEMLYGSLLAGWQHGLDALYVNLQVPCNHPSTSCVSYDVPPSVPNLDLGSSQAK